MLNRKTEDIEELLDGVREAYGAHSIEPYGDWDDPQSVGFRIRGIPLTFSVIVQDHLPQRHYNIQIESYPDLDYLYHERAVSLWGFLELLRHISGPRDNWQKMAPH
jgi:hypothetical protein